MHALAILQRCIAPLLTGIHRRRLAVLLEAVAATVTGPRLTLTEIGRRFGGGSDLRHRIKRADRLLGNAHLRRDAKHIYTALARMLLTGVAEPLVVIDWSDLKEDQSLHLLRASLPVGGRSLTLYEKVHTQRNLGNRQVQHWFLHQLKALLPATAQPIIVADFGFPVRDRGAVLPRGRASGLALGRAGARARLHQAQAPLA
jgi:RNase P protein component